jgi:hypothetical protein
MNEIGLAAGCSALLIAVGHWFPWRALLHRDLHRVEAYIYGVLAVVGGIVLALFGATAPGEIWTLGSMAVGGLVALAAGKEGA